MFQAFLGGHSHLKPSWSRGSQASFAGTVHMLYFKYNSRQNVEVEGKRGNIFIFGLRKQCDTWQAWISFAEAVLHITEIKFDHGWRKTEIPQPGWQGCKSGCSCLLWADSWHLEHIAGAAPPSLCHGDALADGEHRAGERLGASRAACNQRLWTVPSLWDHFPWYWGDYQNTL